MSLIRRILNLQHRKRLDAEIQAELQSHIEMSEEDGIRRGMSEQEARREAILRFGNSGLVHESVADEDMCPASVGNGESVRPLR
jgi:macrolide transport system ATP-binding/permease protein